MINQSIKKKKAKIVKRICFVTLQVHLKWKKRNDKKYHYNNYDNNNNDNNNNPVSYIYIFIAIFM